MIEIAQHRNDFIARSSTSSLDRGIMRNAIQFMQGYAILQPQKSPKMVSVSNPT